jgi:phosphoglycolate phosphatase
MIGDMPSDAEAARANGLRFVAVAWGYGDVDLLAGLGALEVAHSPAELGEILAGL